jgi:hypothetical protein
LTARFKQNPLDCPFLQDKNSAKRAVKQCSTRIKTKELRRDCSILCLLD